MGITLTSKTVSSTYDSLLKLSDNDQLTGAFKLITDGLGTDTGISINDSGDVNISGTLVVGERVNTPILQLTGGVGTQGTFSWNTDEWTVDLIQNGTTLQLGQEVQIHVKNQTGATIPDGTPVYATGTLGASGRITVAPMIADGTIDAKYFLGVTTEDIADGGDGKITTFGKIRGLNTSGYTEGQTLWVSSTVAGAFQTTRPLAPNLDLEVAIVINSHANNGTIFVRSNNGHYLGTAHDVNISSVAENDLLVYKTNRWVNTKSIGDLSAANVTLSGYLRGPATFVIDPAAYGDETGLVQILGDLRVDGTTTTINSTTISVSDKNITLAKDAVTAGDANGAGITIAGANATLTYLSATDDFTFNKSINAVNGTFSGDVTGANLAISNWNDAYSWGDHAGLYSLLGHNHDDRYYTETESDGKYLLNTTDTLDGDLTVTGQLSVTGTIDLSNADLNIGAADIIFDTISTGANRGLIWNVSPSGFLSKLVGGGADGGKVTLFANMDDAITTGNIFEIKDGSLGSLFLGLSHAGILTAGGGTSTQWNTAYSWGNHASAGYLTSVPVPINGDWWNGGFVKVGTDGVMEMGKYMDFHTSDSGGNADYDLRVTVSPGVFSVGGQVNATGGNSSEWNTAFSWGDHDGLYLPIDGKAADSELLDGINSTGFLRRYNELAGSLDLNTLRTSGMYHQDANADAASGSNYPVAYAGLLEVFTNNDGLGNGVHTYQRYSVYNSNDVYFRRYYNGTWSGWNTNIHSGNIGSQSVANASTLDTLDSTQFLRSDVSDTMTGSLTVNGAGVGITATSSQNTGLIVDGGNNSGIIAEFKNSTTKAVINTSGGGYFLGNVGVGITSPAAKLHVFSAGTANVQEIVAVLGSTSTRPVLQFSESTTGTITSGMSLEYNGNGSGDTNYMVINSVANVPRFVVMSGGNVGIGTTSPTEKLEVAGSVMTQGINVFNNSTGGVINTFENYTGYMLNRCYADYNNDGIIVEYQERIGVDGNKTSIGNYSNNDLSLRTNNQDRITIQAGGNVGIGTTSPSAKLEVNGESRFINPNDPLGGSVVSKMLHYAPSPFGFVYRGYSSGAHSIQVQRENNDGEVFALSLQPNGGNVGIGTTSPAHKLDVAGTTNSYLYRIAGVNGLSGYVLPQGYWLGGGSTATNLSFAAETGNGLAFFTNGTTDFRMFINTSGSVGIGTTSPSQKLHVAGNIYATGSIQGGTSVIKSYGGYAMFGSNSAATPLAFGLDGTQYNMVISTSGNVGIGTTSPEQKLHVAGSGKFNSGVTVGDIIASYSGTNSGFEFGNSGSGGQFGFLKWDNSGNYLYLGHSYGSTFNKNLVINSNGNVGIGVTSPSSKLHVNGGITINNPSSTGGQNTNQAIYIQHPSLPAEYFTMGFKDTSRSSEQMQHPNGPYYNTQAFYIECGSAEAGGICLDQDSVHVYGSSDGGATFRVIDKDADLVTFEMLQSSWNGVFRGDVIAYGSMSSLSDKRIKTNIEPYENTLDRLCSLGVYSYNKITAPKDKKDRKEIGVIAQEVQEVFPELVGSEKVSKPSSAGGLEEVLTVDYEHLTAILLQSIKELRNELNDLKAEVKQLKKDK